MMMDYQSALVNQLDPRAKKPVPGLDPSAAGGMETKTDAMPQVGGTGLAADAAAGGGFAPTSTPTDARPTPTWSAGANAGKNSGMILGFDTDKLNDPNSGSAAGSKYTAAAKAFSGGLKQDVGVSRGGLDNMLNYVKGNGFQNAKLVGDDKIDFGDGNGPIDVIGSDGSIRFQNTTDNPVWEAQHGGGGGGSAAPAGGGMFAGSTISPMLQGDAQANIQQALGSLQQPNMLQQLLAQLQKGAA
jgi:hypothetical protein